MRRNRTSLVILAVITLLAAAAVVAGIVIKNRASVFEVEGVITMIDAKSRVASLEFTNPRTGKRVERSVEIADDCEILLNGSPAKMDDLKPGEKAVVKALYKKKQVLRPLSVRVVRGAETSPASAPAA